MSANAGKGDNQFGDLSDERLRRIRNRVSRVEPELGPGGLFKFSVLGSVGMALDPGEYRQRWGSIFTTATPAIEVRNPPELNRRIYFIMRRVSVEPEIVVLLQPGHVAWFPILDGYLYEANSIDPVSPCAVK
jgi:hypothetical protein